MALHCLPQIAKTKTKTKRAYEEKENVTDKRDKVIKVMIRRGKGGDGESNVRMALGWWWLWWLNNKCSCLALARRGR